MICFSNISQKIEHWTNDATHPLSVIGPTTHQWALIFSNISSKLEKNQLIICPSSDEAERLYETLKSFKNLPYPLYLFPGLECSPYSSIIPSEKNLFSRFYLLDHIANSRSPKIIVATAESSQLLNPHPDFFIEQSENIAIEDIVAPSELIKKLIDLGYRNSPTVEEPGTYSHKGEILDIFPVSKAPIRLQYYDDMIENIHPIDPITQKSDRSISINEVHLSPSPHIITKPEYRSRIRDHLPMPKPGQKEMFERRKDILERLSNNELFDNYSFFVPLCFDNNCHLFDYFSNKDSIVTLVQPHHVTIEADQLHELLNSQYSDYLDLDDSSHIAPNYQEIYSFHEFNKFSLFPVIKVDDLTLDLTSELAETLNLEIIPIKTFLAQNTTIPSDRGGFITTLFQFVSRYFENSGNLIITVSSDSAKTEISFLLDKYCQNSTLPSRTHYISGKIQSGFYYSSDKTLVISDSDLFAFKSNKAKKTKQLDPFAEQLATLQVNDYVIHSQHGVGKYLGLESIETSGTKTDFLVLEYTSNDKVYVPVYRMNLISKHSDARSGAHVASLRSNKFASQIARAKASVKKLAFDLIELEAQRRAARSHTFSPPDHNYFDFELSFPFKETSDQKTAIENVIDSMQRNQPMDHLVCGDVGFGKTEVAMRASFLAVLDKKQVAILVPTTILALQHYLSFQKRFKDFPVTIEFLSRFKTPKESKIIKEQLEEGSIDIIIGTHKLISPSIKYKDLGLLIIDEEHRFGVNHKEKLKLIKSTVDCLTLTATPIPRTLQLSFMGLKELSLIQTAPPKRQSIKTYLVKFDPQTIKDAIDKELARGGQVFFVHNRVQDIEKVYCELQELVPKAKILIAHGQLQERDLENRMRDFYLGKYQILLATTIVESGIDIPNANTLIVNRSDCFGLAQLHQLRGRIGRSDRKAYAYFVIPNNRNLTPLAETRLKTLQMYADIGSGFSIASSDLEIRGAGNILGAEQSGHIEAIGLELYMELIQEAIADITNKKVATHKDITINVPFPSYIPSTYIKEPSERLRQYKKLSNCYSHDQLEQYREELNDRFGYFPSEVENLFTILIVRSLLINKGIESLSLAGKIINISFDRQFLENNPSTRDTVLDYFLSRPRKFKLSPNFAVTYTAPNEIDLSQLLNFSKDIAEQIVLC